MVEGPPYTLRRGCNHIHCEFRQQKFGSLMITQGASCDIFTPGICWRGTKETNGFQRAGHWRQIGILYELNLQIFLNCFNSFPLIQLISFIHVHAFCMKCEYNSEPFEFRLQSSSGKITYGSADYIDHRWKLDWCEAHYR